MKVDVNVNDAVITLDGIITALPGKIEQCLDRACLVVENEAKTKCPVDTGDLRNSIDHKVDGLTGEIGSNLHYAPYVELGTGIYAAGGRQTPWVYQDYKGKWHTTKGQEGKHFLRNALTSSVGAIQDEMKGIFE